MAKKANTASKKGAIKRRGSIAKSSGSTSGMGICSFFANIFETNEELSKKCKLTDDQILLRLQLEFPDRAENFSSGKYTINMYRGWYNSGRLTSNVPPLQMSFRYGPKGTKVNARIGRRELLPEEVIHFEKLHKAKVEQSQKGIRSKLKAS